MHRTLSGFLFLTKSRNAPYLVQNLKRMIMAHECGSRHPNDRLWLNVLEGVPRNVFSLILAEACRVRLDGREFLLFENFKMFWERIRSEDTEASVRNILTNANRFVVRFGRSPRSLYLAFECLYEAEEFLANPEWEIMANKVYGQYLAVCSAEMTMPEKKFPTAWAMPQEVAGIRHRPIIGSSAVMQEIQELTRRAAGADVPVLITGETGVGKELIAEMLHLESTRQSGPFVKRNCAAFPGELLESELFGHERGAFTGADRRHEGAFSQADSGTLFLDEIGEMPLRLQPKILHVLQDGQFSRIGGRVTLTADVRIVAATNRNLVAEIKSGRFREDLYWRVNVVDIHVPPLRERPEDILPLVDHFMCSIAAQYKVPVPEISSSTLDLLVAHKWPGNIRELENLLRRVIVLGNADSVIRSHILLFEGETEAPRFSALPPLSEKPQSTSLKEISRRAVYAAERQVIEAALKRHRWNRVQTAKSLKVCYRTLLYKIKEMKLRPDDQETGAYEAAPVQAPISPAREKTPDPVVAIPKTDIHVREQECREPVNRRAEVLKAFVACDWNRRKVAEKLNLVIGSVSAYLSMYDLRPEEKKWLEGKIAEGVGLDGLRQLIGTGRGHIESLLRRHGLTLIL